MTSMYHHRGHRERSENGNSVFSVISVVIKKLIGNMVCVLRQ